MCGRRQQPAAYRGRAILELTLVGTSILTDVYLYTMAVATMAAARRGLGTKGLTVNNWKEDTRQFYASGLGLAYGAALLVPVLGTRFFGIREHFLDLAVHCLRGFGMILLVLRHSYPMMVTGNVLHGLAAGFTLVRGVWAIADWRAADMLGVVMSLWTVALCFLMHLPALLLFEWNEALDQKIEPRYRVWTVGLFFVVVSILLNVVSLTLKRAEASATEQVPWPRPWTAQLTRRASRASVEAINRMREKSAIAIELKAWSHGRRQRLRDDLDAEEEPQQSRLPDGHVRLQADLVGLGFTWMIITALIPLLYKLMSAQDKYWNKSLCENMTIGFLVSVLFACISLYLVGTLGLPWVSVPLGMLTAWTFLNLLYHSPWHFPKAFRTVVVSEGFRMLPGDPLPEAQWAGHIALVACTSLALTALVKDAFDIIAQTAEKRKDAEEARKYLRNALLGVPMALGIGYILGNVPSMLVWGGGMQKAADASVCGAVRTILLPLHFGASFPFLCSIFFFYRRGATKTQTSEGGTV